jgi:VCBS repeat-containing protein
LQDVDANSDGESDVWASWDAEWRDLMLLDANNRKLNATVNLTTFDLRTAANYASLKQLLIERAQANAQIAAPSGIDLQPQSDTGADTADNRTRLNNSNGQTLVFRVSGVTSGAVVRLFADGTLIGQGTASGTQIDITTNNTAGLADGTRNITATQQVGDTHSPSSLAFQIVVDTIAPAAITPAAPSQAIVGVPYSYDAQNTEEGSTGIRYSLTNAPSGASIDATSGVLSWTPAAGQEGSVNFSIVATDAAGNSATLPVSVNVAGALPVGSDQYSVNEDGVLTIPVAQGVRINDGDTQSPPGSLTVTLVNNVGNGALTLNSDGSFTYTPAANFSGTDTFTYRASDGTRTSSPATVTITVSGVNDPPVAVNDAYAAISGQILNVNAGSGVLDNDSDIDSQTLAVALAAGPAHGTLTLNPDGSFSYTSTAGFSGADSFTYTVSDGSATSNTATVTITVNNVPVAVADSYTVNEDGSLTISVAEGLLDNDTDVENDPLTAEVMIQPAHGTLALAANGSFTYTPTANFSGTDSFTYRARDASHPSAPATVTFTITAVNDAPSAAADTYRVDRDGTLTVGVSNGVLGNDTDADSDPMTVAVVDTPDHGTLTLNPNGSFTYTPTAGYSGPDTFTYRSSDGTLDSTPATVTINVNSAPTAVGDSYQATEDQPLVVAAGTGVLLNDTDIESDSLTAEIVTQPANGTVTLAADGSFTYTPSANFTGTDSFTYRSRDASLSSAAATVTISVQGVNDAPAGVADDYEVDEDTILSILAVDSVLANDTDPESDSLTAELVTSPQHGTVTFNANGTFTYTPSANFSGADSFTYRARDAALQSSPVTVNITVRPTNDPPLFTQLPFGTLPAFNLISGDVARIINPAEDLDATTSVHYSLVSGPTGATVNPVTGQFRWDIPQDLQGRFLVTVRAIEDNAAALFADATFAIDVTPVSAFLGALTRPSRRDGFGDTRDRTVDARAGALRAGTIIRNPSLDLGVIGQTRTNSISRIQGSGDIRLRREKEDRERRSKRAEEAEETTTPPPSVSPTSDSTGSGAALDNPEILKTSDASPKSKSAGWSEEALADLEFSPGDVAALKLTSFMLPAWSATETTATAISLLKHLEIDELLDSAQFAALAESVGEMLKNPPEKSQTSLRANASAHDRADASRQESLRHALHAAAMAATSFMPLLVTQLNRRQHSKHARLRAFLERLGS